MSSNQFKIFESYDEAIKFLKAQSKNIKEFKGSIEIDIREDSAEDQLMCVEYEHAIANGFTEFLNRNYDASTRDTKWSWIQTTMDYRYHEIAEKYKETLDEILYNNNSDFNSSLFVGSIYCSKDSPCHIELPPNAIPQKTMLEAIVHEYKNRFLCIEFSDKMFYFFNNDQILIVRSVQDAEQVILNILDRIFSINYTRKTYGY